MFDTSLFQFHKVWRLSPTLQIIAILCLHVVMILATFFFHPSAGSGNGFPLFTLFFAPLYEEIIFRGFIFKAFLNHNNLSRAIIFSSIIFGLWHLKNIFYLEPGYLIYQIAFTTLILGPLLSWITFRSKTIWIGVILHYINNLSGFLLLWIFHLS